MNGAKEGEEIEGLDESHTAGWGEYPLDSVFVRTEMRTVGEVVKRIEAKRYDLNPEFQREFVWHLDTQSRLIESALMRIPLPVFYMAEAKDGRIVVVDGLQRLTTFLNFIKEEFALTGLADGKEGQNKENPLLGKKFSDLPVNLQERIEDTQLTLHILDAKAPERAKLDIFERVNGGAPLTRQQMRNCIYSGAATRWLAEAAETKEFLTATDKKLDRKSMRDREAINRFCAFRLLGFEAYKGDMDTFLAEALEKMNKSSEQELDSVMESFRQSMKINRDLFGKHAFRKSLAAQGNGARTVINIALFDVCSVLLAESSSLEGPSREKVKEAVVRLIEDNSFNSAITYSTNGTMQVRTRFTMAKEVIDKALEC